MGQRRPSRSDLTSIVAAPRTERPAPSWWSRNHQGAWDRVKALLYREWVQVAAERGARARVARAERASELLAENQNGEVDWRMAHNAILFGYVAAVSPDAQPEWGSELERALEKDWTRLAGAWAAVRLLVRRGWQQGCDDRSGWSNG